MKRAIILIAFFLILCSSAEAKTYFGFNDSKEHWSVGAEAADSLGANVARIPMGWDVPPSDFADINAKLEALGIRPIILLWGCSYPDLEEFKAQVRKWTLAYPNAIIQIWNEPNISLFGTFTPTQAAEIAVAGVQAVRSVDPNRIVIGPSLAPDIKDGKITANYKSYMKAIYTALRPYKVGVSLHMFPYANPMKTVKLMHKYVSRFGRVWVTEMGFSKEYFGENQGKVSANAYRVLMKLGVKSVVYHRLLPMNTVSGKAGGCTGSVSDTLPEGYPPPVDWGQALTIAWEEQSAMSVLDNPKLAKALKKARKKRK